MRKSVAVTFAVAVVVTVVFVATACGARVYTMPPTYDTSPSYDTSPAYETPTTGYVTATTRYVAPPAASSSTGLEGSTWTGTVALTMVTVVFESGGRYTCAEFGNGTYSVYGDQVSLVPSGGRPTRVFVLGNSIMAGNVDGWACTLTRQSGGGSASPGSGGGYAGLEGTTWMGTVALTMVTVVFQDGGRYTCAEFGNGTYSVNGSQVSLVPSGGRPTRDFILGGNVMQGSVDGWPCSLIKQ